MARRHLIFPTLGVLGLLALAPAAAQAEDRPAPPRVDVLRANLEPVPHHPSADSGSNVSGRATLVQRGEELRAVLFARGLSPNLPHVAHIHGRIDAVNECPSLAADTNDDGLIDTLEGLPAYGPIDVSFTTSGGTSGAFADALALDRAPVANRAGILTYQREFALPDVPVDSATLADSLDDLHIVIHGEDLNDNGKYDGALSPVLSMAAGGDVPLEAELPVACGTLD